MSNDDETVYDVLFYKRTQKVHKSRGVSKIDGLLKLRGNGRIELHRHLAETESSESEDDTQKLSWKEKRKLQNKKRGKSSSSSTVYSGIHRDVATEFAEEQILQFGGYEVQIVSQQGKAINQKTHQPPAMSQPKKILLSSQRSPALLTNKGSTISHMKKTVTTNKKRAPTLNRTQFDPKKIKSVHGIKSDIVPNRRSTDTKTLPSSQQLKPTQPGKETLKIPPNSGSVLPHIPLPNSIRSALRPHQVFGVDFLWKTLNSLNGCILGDEMGLGKTLMTIACIVARHRSQRDQHFVVVCPSSLTANWANEFDKWLGKASQPKRVVIQKGGAEGLSQIRAYTSKLRRQVSNQAGQVLIVSYDLFRRNATEFKFSTAVNLLVVDEGHKLKNANGSQTLAALQGLNAHARLCLTATPIQNNLREFYQLANFCCPGILGDDPSSFMTEFERPIAAANQKSASPQQLAVGRAKSAELQVIADKFLLRRLQKDVLTTMLPPRTEVLLFCRPQTDQRVAYQNLSLNSSAEPLALITSLRKVCCHPRLADGIPTENNIAQSAKLVVLDALLQEIRQLGNEKVVIVSNFTSVLTCIENLILQNRSYTYGRLDGSTDQRQNIVDTFHNTSQFCLLLSSKAGGCGLNLTGASRMVLFDPEWNPSSDVQAMGRIYRQGQKRACFIYRLFTSGTVEEIIYQRQVLKRGLSALTVDGRSQQHSAAFTNEELRDCFTLQDTRCDTKNKTTGWPDYNGPDSLVSQGINDRVLLRLAEHRNAAAILGHIHIVKEEEGDSTLDANASDDEQDGVAPKLKDGHESDSSGEYEFD